MDLKHLTDETLHCETHRLNREHNQILTALLHHLRENERRRLFSAHKYESLFAYVVGELKYSESEAIRRISAMRLLRDIPAIEKKISGGELSLTNLALAQRLFSKEKKAGRPLTKFQKAEVLNKLENQSTRSAERIVAAISPESKKAELDFSGISDEALREKLLKLKGQLAHKHPNLSLNELLHKICDAQLDMNRKRSPVAPNVKGSPPSAPKVGSTATPNEPMSIAETKRQLWARDEHCCTNCGSHYAVEEDHRIPRSMGGDDSLENLRLLCRNCNQRAAIEFFGVGKMEEFLA